MEVTLDLYDNLDSDLIRFESITGTPEEIMFEMDSLMLPPRFVDEVDDLFNKLTDELPGTAVSAEFAKYEAVLTKC